MGDDKLKLIAHELLTSLREHLRRLGAARLGAGADARPGQAHPTQIWLPARPSRCGGADRAPAGGGALGQLDDARQAPGLVT